MPTLKELQTIPNAVQPTAGQGLTLDLNGLLPPNILAPSPADNLPLTYDAATNQAKWESLSQSAITFDGWQAYTPVLTASTSNPTLGSGGSFTQQGRYVQIGKTVIAVVRLVFGTSGATAGTGTYSWSLPVTAATTMTTPTAGSVWLYDNSANALAQPFIYVSTSTTAQMNYPATWPTGVNTVVADATPWVWAASDQMNFFVVYEAA